MSKIHTITDQGNPVAFYLDPQGAVWADHLAFEAFVASSVERLRPGKLIVPNGDTINAETMKGIARALRREASGC